MLRWLPWVAAAWPWCWVLWLGLPAGHDLPLELMRLAQYQRALSDEQWPPFWAPDLYAGFGSPIFLFYGQLCLALASAWSYLTGSLGTGLMLAMACASAVAVFGLQRAAAALSPQPSAAGGRIACYLFLLCPYLLGDALLRNACAEYVALCGMPLGLYGLVLLRREPARAAVWLALGTCWVATTHTLSALTWLAMALTLTLWTLGFMRARLRHWLHAGEGLGLGLALSAFVWLPALLWKPAIRSAELVTGRFDFHSHFQTWSTMFGVEHFAGAGPLPLLAAACACWAWRAPQLRAALGGLLLCTCVLWFMQTPASTPLWEHIPWLPLYQFPWRFMGPLSCLTALLGGLAFTTLTTELRPRMQLALELSVLLVCLSVSLAPLLHMQPLPRAEQYRWQAMLQPRGLRSSAQSSTVGDEYLPLHASADGLLMRSTTPPITSATHQLRIVIRTAEPRLIALDVKAQQPSELCLTRWWFAFWQVSVDGQTQPGEACVDGSVRISIPTGRHHVRAQLLQPRERTWGLILSGLGLLGLLWTWRSRSRSRSQHVTASSSKRPNPRLVSS